VISSANFTAWPCPRSAKAHKRKDGTGVFVIARHELALQPGLAAWEAFHDPNESANFARTAEIDFVRLKKKQQRFWFPAGRRFAKHSGFHKIFQFSRTARTVLRGTRWWETVVTR